MRPKARKRRFHWLDVAIIAAVIALVAFVALRVNSVLRYDWDWTYIPNYILRHDAEEGWVANLLLHGFLTTLRLAIWGNILAAVIASSSASAGSAAACSCAWSAGPMWS